MSGDKEKCSGGIRSIICQNRIRFRTNINENGWINNAFYNCLQRLKLNHLRYRVNRIGIFL
jgi:hypothetical protein